MCGEKMPVYRSLVSILGSPPRVRGKVLRAESLTSPARITPACAGKRRRPASGGSRGGDHPRVCGEKGPHPRSPSAGQGSPPRVRGKACTRCEDIGSFGITPACAGKSGRLSRSFRQNQDHPRVCGEKELTELGWLECPGSPPRVRGKVSGIDHSVWHSGITPACAGKRSSDRG